MVCQSKAKGKDEEDGDNDNDLGNHKRHCKENPNEEEFQKNFAKNRRKHEIVKGGQKCKRCKRERSLADFEADHKTCTECRGGGNKQSQQYRAAMARWHKK